MMSIPLFMMFILLSPLHNTLEMCLLAAHETRRQQGLYFSCLPVCLCVCVLLPVTDVSLHFSADIDAAHSDPCVFVFLPT